MDKNTFISMSTNLGVDTSISRQMLVDKFDIVHNNVECAHDTAEILYLANYALYNQNIPGPIFEFGSYKGGMTCKLSHVAKLLNKELIIFDTFMGLLEDATYTKQDNLKDDSYIINNFTTGMFAGSMREVDTNLNNYGEISPCGYYPGDAKESILQYNIDPFLAFIDVDNIPTMKYLIKNLWNRIQSGLIFFHESCLVETGQELYSDSFKQELGENNVLLGHIFYGTQYSLPNTNCLNFIAKENVQLGQIFLNHF